MKTEVIKIEALERNGLQTRVALDEGTVEEYAEAMRSRAKFPPVHVFRDGATNYLADGFHRVEAASRAGFSAIRAEVEEGGFVSALRFALKANSAHGLRRTNADKQRSLAMAWEHRAELFGRSDADPSLEVLAEACGVSRSSVQRFVEDNRSVTAPVPPPASAHVPPPPPTRKVFGMDGKTRSVPAPVRPPTLPPTPAPTPAPADRPCREGYYIAEDGLEHAIGVELDRFFTEIPQELKGAFTDGKRRMVDISATVRNAREMLADLSADGGRLVVPQSIDIHLEAALVELKGARPYCVCRICQGRGCQACTDKGYQTKDQYSRNPREYRGPEERE